MTEQEVIRLAAQAAIDVFNEKIKAQKERNKENTQENTKRLLKGYKELKAHCESAIVSIEDTAPTNLQLLLSEVFDQRGFIQIQSIAASKKRTELMIAHADAMLETYRKQCAYNNTAYFRILMRYYIYGDDMLTIAEDESVAERTAWKYLQKATEDMSILLWGLIGLP